MAPDPETFAQFMAWLEAQGDQRHVIALMAEFASVASARHVKLLRLTLDQIDSEAAVM